MSFKIGNPFSKLVNTVEKTAGNAARAAEGAVGQATNTVKGAVDQFEKSAGTVANALKGPLTEAGNFVQASADSLAQAVGLSPTPAEPQVLRGQQGNAAYSPSQGQLFVGQPGADDVVQGQAGDCYFLSSVASLAQNHPDAIRNAIHQNTDGTYTVTFHVPQGFGALEALGPAGGLMEGTALGIADHLGLHPGEKTVQVTVDGKLPTDKNGNPLYVQDNKPGELWVPIMEKAYAKLWGSYGAIGNGGDPGTAMRALTGGNVVHHDLNDPLQSTLDVKIFPQSVSPNQADAVYDDLRAATGGKKMVVASTYQANLPQQMPGIVNGHCYSVLGVSEENGQKYVTLRNPWGNTVPGNQDSPDGVFKLTVQQFMTQFGSYDVGEVP